MDIFSILGLLVAFVGVVGGMVYDGGHSGSLFGLGAFMIVIVGSFGATIVATLPSDLQFALASCRRIFAPRKYDFQGITEKILELANLARREGLLALESYTTSGHGDPFLVKCLTLAIDGSSAETIRETVEVEMHIEEEDDRAGMKFWETWGALAPTVGVIGAVLGLMHVMSVLDKTGRDRTRHRDRVRRDGLRRRFREPRGPADVVQAQAPHRARPAAEEHDPRGRRRHPIGDRAGCAAQQAQAYLGSHAVAQPQT
jgi:hypothetical protein